MDRPASDPCDDLAEALDRALVEGPQTIFRASGAVVVVSAVEYERLTRHASKLKRLLFDGPPLDGLNLARDRSLARDVDVGTG